MNSDPLWKTRTGKSIAVKDMTDEHILNAWRVISRYQISLDDPSKDWGCAPNVRRYREQMVKVWTPIFDREFKARKLTPKPFVDRHEIELQRLRRIIASFSEHVDPSPNWIDRFVSWIVRVCR